MFFTPKHFNMCWKVKTCVNFTDDFFSIFFCKCPRGPQRRVGTDIPLTCTTGKVRDRVTSLYLK